MALFQTTYVLWYANGHYALCSTNLQVCIFVCGEKSHLYRLARMYITDAKPCFIAFWWLPTLSIILHSVYQSAIIVCIQCILSFFGFAILLHVKERFIVHRSLWYRKKNVACLVSVFGSCSNTMHVHTYIQIHTHLKMCIPVLLARVWYQTCYL